MAALNGTQDGGCERVTAIQVKKGMLKYFICKCVCTKGYIYIFYIENK